MSGMAPCLLCFFKKRSIVRNWVVGHGGFGRVLKVSVANGKVNVNHCFKTKHACFLYVSKSMIRSCAINVD